MFMKKLLIFLMVSLSYSLFAQLEISKENSEEEKDLMVIEPLPNAHSEVFILANWSKTTRELIPNTGIFEGELGERANETGIDTWSFGIGIRNEINRFLSWEGGLSLLKNGEEYLYKELDSSYKYVNTYSYIGMPIKLLFTYGDKFKLIAGAGVVPQMFVGLKTKTSWTNSKNVNESEEIKVKSGYNSFVVSGVFNLGGQVSLGQKLSLNIIPEYRLQLNSSFVSIDKFKHFGRSFGVNMGLSYKI
jgi:hypothetical protein